MFRDDGDAARARAEALELQKQELKDELAAKDKLLREKEEELRSRDKKLRALTTSRGTRETEAAPIFNEPPSRSFLSSRLFFKLVFALIMVGGMFLFKTCSS
jgi:hypothetical protein